MTERAVILMPFMRSCLDTNMFNSILIRVKITIQQISLFDFSGFPFSDIIFENVDVIIKECEFDFWYQNAL